MGTEGEDGSDQHKATSIPQPQARIRRRPRQRNHGPPQLQFLTATDPAQFKGENAKRSVRSQAMMQYRYQASEKKRKPKGADAALAVDVQRSEQGTSTRDRVPVLLNDDANDGASSPWLEEPQELIYDTTSEAWWRKNANARNLAMERGIAPTWTPERDVDPCTYASDMTAAEHGRSSRYLRALAILPKSSRDKCVMRYQETEAHDAEFLSIIAATIKDSALDLGLTSSKKMHVVGIGMDPFAVIPQFRHPELNSVFLVRKCNRAFSTKFTLQKWLPVMLSDPHILLSSTVMATTWLDMHAGICGESKRTVLLKQEAIGYINERLRDARAMEDSTLAVVIHVLAGEMWSANEKTMRIHQDGIARLIAHRGGMSQLGGNGIVAQAAAACTYHGNLICEDSPLPLFYRWNAPPFEVGQTEAVPESPLWCPRMDFVTAVQDHACCESTHDLLCDMRDLTDLFIAHNAASDAVEDIDAYVQDARRRSASTEYDKKLFEMRARLASLPSARLPGLPTTNNWVYEACRMASIIYASAIIMRVPLSLAAEPGRNIIMRDIMSLEGSFESSQAFTPRLTETLYEVMEKTNIGDLWNNMSGVFYWVVTVGAAAARTPVNIDMYSRPNCASDAYATWVRRCMIMFSARAMILILFAHPLPLILSQKKLLKVQELLGSGSSRTLHS